MPQQTNLNVAPYFDDFDSANDYYRVLFKPGYPIQARELTTLQSILQDQIEKFGQHFFKEGSKVIPGNTGYSRLYYCVQLDNNYQGVPVSAYAEQLVGTKITGQRSGVTAYVDFVLFPEDSERGNLTLYVNYLSSSTQNNLTQTFNDGEELSSDQIISSGLLGNATIQRGTPFATTLASNSSAVGSAFHIENGVYFVRGNFVSVNRETLVLEQYTNAPNYRIGLFVNEEIITSDIDESLNDNSQGYNNYSAPGADRLKISLSLIKKDLDDFDDTSFVELATVINGVLRTKTVVGGSTSPGTSGFGYKDLSDTLARRTYDESGDYYVSPFNVTLKNSLNDNLGNRGLYNAGQFTPSGGTPSDDLGVYRISPGKAFVRGYEIEVQSPVFIDVPKPRTTRTIEDQSLLYNTGSTIKLNRVFRTPTVGLGNTYFVSLRDSRSTGDIDGDGPPGNEIGLARIYDFKLDSGSYGETNSNTNVWGISLFDIQTFSNITLNEPITLSTPTFIKGENSGATAFLRYPVSAGVALTVYEKSGNFVANETLSFNGIQNGRVAVAITETGISKAKSLYGTTDGVVGINTFSADIVQSLSANIGIATVSEVSAGVSTITSSNTIFPGIIKIGDLIQYSDLSITEDPITASVIGIGESAVSVRGVTTVSGVANGNLPSSDLNITDLRVLSTKLSESDDNTLFTELPKKNVSNVDLSDAYLTIRKTFEVDIANNQLTSSTLPTSDENELFLPFIPRRYSLIRSDGTTESLTSDKFEFGSNGKTCQISGLGSDDTGATLIATLRKLKPKSKVKIKNKANSIIIDKSKYSGSGIGATTLNDGLIYGNYPFGTRVQDEILSLNVPDIIEIHGIFESSSTNNPSSPQMTLSGLNTPTTTTSDLLLGEMIVGQSSGAAAILVEKQSDSEISFIYKNQIKFREGENVSFQDSNANGTIIGLESPSFEISSNYTFGSGQQKSFYDYGFIKRRVDSEEPSKRLKVYFSSGYHDQTDQGDITTINSYNAYNYSREIKSIDAISNSDIIDIRPRVSNYSVEEGVRSPLEFLGRTFNQSGNSSTNILASDETLFLDFSYYLGRIDRIFLTKDGKFQVIYGTPSDRPEKPMNVDDALEIASISHPPYLYSPEQSIIQFLEYKRYQMSDIKKLENRIRNLEYYTSLSLLETNTANLFVPDSEGLNRFKSGFFVDNFSSFKPQDNLIDINNSIDKELKELRPKHYTTSVDLIPGPVVNIDPTDDLAFSFIEGNNVRKQNDIITLSYSEVEWLKQSFATRSESVTPFLISFWQGTIELTPASDNWVDPVRLDAKIIEIEGNYAETLADATKNLNVDPQTGFAPIVWNAWSTNWTGVTDVTRSTRNRSEESRNSFWRGRQNIERTTTSTIEEEVRTTVENGVESRNGIRTVVTEEFERTSTGDRVVSRELVANMRSRNIQFVSKRMKPLTRIYAFFDGVDVTKYCVPKLIEISMSNGVFEIGETVEGSIQTTGLDEDTTNTSPSITFRVAQSNHRDGPYDSPITIFPENPYTNRILPATYSSTSNILNVDTFSLSNEAQGDYHGWIESGMVLTGRSSGAQATITNVRLVSDLSATLIGSFYIPNPNNINHPKFETGTQVFTLVNDEDNDQNLATTIAEEPYSASGVLETVQENIISIRNARIEQRQEFDERSVSRTLGTEVISSRVTGTTTSPERTIGWRDPLSQSFIVEDDTGIFLSKCDIFFRSRDDMDIPVILQIRTMKNGYPSQNIVPLSEVVLDPNDVETSSDGSVATTFQFKSPIYLEGGNSEYCMCILSNSTKYSVYISRIGENDILSDTFISNQPYLGSLFKSQNASTWEASQWEDLKFTLYRADFLDSGSVEFYSPELKEGNDQIPTLMPDSLVFKSRKIRVGLGTTVADSYENGNTFSQSGTNATGDLVGVAGTAVNDLSIINPGIGYTPSASQFTFSGVNLTTISGSGRGALADITINNGVAIAATISGAGGSGYQIGDVVGVSTIGSNSIGRNARFSIVAIGDTSELILDNVQGEFIIGSSNPVFYTNSSGVLTELNNENGGDVQISSINVDSDGLHVKVNHKNHGMYFEDNLVRISGAQSDVKPTKLSSAYNVDSVGSISVDDSTSFTTFENVGIGTTNTGFIKIGDEIIEYTDVTGNTLGGNISRGSNPKSYPAGTPVYKYELNGINLSRINRTHDLSNVTLDNPIAFDSYHIKLDTAEIFNPSNDDRSDDIGYAKLYGNQTKSAGGYNTKASQNIPFEIITPMVQNVTVHGTNLTGQVRTTTSKSLSGNEIPFVDAGFEPVTLNESNYLESPRLIGSKVNENLHLNNSPGNKSMNLRLFLNTTDSRISPVIDAQRVSAILTSNRVNDVISDYATDSRVNGIDTDPTACQYISKEIILKNPASSLKILVNAHINENNDIRAFYAISDTQGFNPIFEPFPGFNNIDSRGQIISAEDNNGESDVFIPKTNSKGFDGETLDYKEYTFTADQLPSFRSYKIKLIMTSTDQVYVPRIKDLRVIALA